MVNINENEKEEETGYSKAEKGSDALMLQLFLSVLAGQVGGTGSMHTYKLHILSMPIIASPSS